MDSGIVIRMLKIELFDQSKRLMFDFEKFRKRRYCIRSPCGTQTDSFREKNLLLLKDILREDL